jgi:ribosome-binding protein aMBF1 (putative translation factor)
MDYFSVVCDRCGVDAFEDADHSAWSSAASAREHADWDDWKEIDDKDYCFQCYELDENTDEYVVKAPTRQQRGLNE